MAASCAKPSVHLVAFSKDRAFQLHLFLSSLLQRVQREDVSFQASVLYLASEADGEDPDFAASYARVAERHPNVAMVAERQGCFAEQLDNILQQQHSNGAADSYIAFAVDDMVFFDDFDLRTAVDTLKDDPSVFAFHLKLGPHVTYSHPAGKACIVPEMRLVTAAAAAAATPSITAAAAAPATSATVASSSAASSPTATAGTAVEASAGPPLPSGQDPEDGRDHGDSALAEERRQQRHRQRRRGFARTDAYVFARRDGSLDWDYPWDLTGGVYRRGDALAVLAGVRAEMGESAVANPNLFEHNGHLWLRKLQQGGGHGRNPAATANGTGGGGGDSGRRGGGIAGGGGTAVGAETATTGNAAHAGLCVGPNCACPGWPVVVAVTVNRVQTTYDTPTYAAAGSDVAALDRLFWQPGPLWETDSTAYAASRFSSVHVGQLLLRRCRRKNECSTESLEEDATPWTTMAAEEKAGAAELQPIAAHEAASVAIMPAALGSPKRPLALRPLVSVLLPVRNGGRHLWDAVASVLAQDMPRFELILVDDASDDGAVAAAAQLLRGDSRVRILTKREPAGLAACLNDGLAAAAAALVARMDADDLCHPQRLRRQLRYMEGDTTTLAVGSAVALFSGLDELRRTVGGSCGGSVSSENFGAAEEENGGIPAAVCKTARLCKMQDRSSSACNGGRSSGVGDGDDHDGWPLRVPRHEVSRVVRHPTDPLFAAWSLLFSCCIAHPSVMLRRDAVVAAGGYHADAFPAEDYDLWLRLSRAAPGGVRSMGEVLLFLRRHGENTSRRKRSEQQAAALAAATAAASELLLEVMVAAGAGNVEATAAAAIPAAEAGQAAPEVTVADMEAMRCPEEAEAPAAAMGAARLLRRLEDAMCLRIATASAAAPKAASNGGSNNGEGGQTGSNSDDNGENSSSSGVGTDGGDGTCLLIGDPAADVAAEEIRRQAAMIRADAAARLSALALHAVARFGPAAASVLTLCMPRRPPNCRSR
ncbi:unnamed protein product [Phaeothamnion confervicola]